MEYLRAQRSVQRPLPGTSKINRMQVQNSRAPGCTVGQLENEVENRNSVVNVGQQFDVLLDDVPHLQARKGWHEKVV